MRAGAFKKVLASLIVLGAMSYLTIGGVFAIYNGELTNKASTAATGTFTFSNTVNAGTACLSYGSGTTQNVNPGCDALLANTTLHYPGVLATATVTINDTGSLPTDDLLLYMPNCTSTTSPNAGFVGGTGLCSGTSTLAFYIQETNAAGTTNIQCWYPTTTTACPVTNSTFEQFATNYNDVTSAWDLGRPDRRRNALLQDRARASIGGGQRPPGRRGRLRPDLASPDGELIDDRLSSHNGRGDHRITRRGAHGSADRRA